MQTETPQNWFIHQVAKEAFYIYAITWGLLFLLENLKEGLVSNYLSLSHAAIPLLFLGVLWLAISPENEDKPNDTKPAFSIIPLIGLSILIVLVWPLILEASFALTLLIIFATLAALWGGALSFWKQ